MPTENKQAEPAFNLDTPDGGRGYIANLFRTILKRHDYRQYISERLAGDFACTLAQHFEDIKAREVALQQRLTAADERVDQLTQQLAIESAIKEPAGEDVLWQVLDAAVGVLTRRAAPHAWESEAHQAGLKIILARRAGLAATALKPAEGGGDDA